MSAETRDAALEIFTAIVESVIFLKPELGLAFVEGFHWVDAFLQGKERSS
ncbi:hypothetical protein [Reticulibacter mediterranei]|nr:hypothetical protein [Reticulibacter mediterranei]